MKNTLDHKAACFAVSPLAIVLLLLILTTSGGDCWAAARLIERITFEQPDGTVVELRGHGNEYQARYETLDGYTVIFVPESKAYFFAAVSEDGEELVSSGLQVGQGDPEGLGLERHVQINAEAARDQALRRRHEWESRMGLRERWAKLKASASESGDLQAKGVRYRNTIGTKVGLTLLIDFDDTPATVPSSNIVQFLNGDNYRANGNNGSVKEYFRDVSNGKLLYTNIVIGFIRIPSSVRPRSYYNDVNRLAWDPVNELIRDAILVLTNQPNYMTEIVPRLEALSVNESGEVLALNLFVAGNDSAVWTKGLWPHASNLEFVGPQELWPGGKKVNRYQITTITVFDSPLQIAAFCHETGHLLCDFPDLYDYDDESAGGSGNFCLMGVGGPAVPWTNPPHFCAYLKLMAGWATIIDIFPGPATNIVLNAPGTEANQFLRLRFSTEPRILSSSEYFLIENRQKTRRDAGIPGSGILVWHIDERGDHSNENVLPNSMHANYEATLVQADGRYDLQAFANHGDASDPFYRGNSSAGYQNRFADDTTPGASWWDGTRSGLELRDFSTRSNQMTLVAEVKRPRILRDPISQLVNLQDDLFLSVQMLTNQPYTYRWFKGEVPLARNERVTGVDGPVLAIHGVTAPDAGTYRVVITDSSSHSETSRVAQVGISTLRQLASLDLGDASRMSGTTTILSNSFQISAGGSGLVGAADNCRFFFETVSGDFDARLQVVDVASEDGRSGHTGGSGLMIRAGLDASSAQAAVLIRPSGNPFLESGEVQALARFSRSDAVEEVGWAGGIPSVPGSRNNWLRVRRESSLVSMYHSTNGTRWDLLKTVSLPLESTALVGIAASSCNPVTRIVTGVRSYSVLTNAPPTFAISTVKNSAQEGASDRATLAVVSSRNGPLAIGYTVGEPAANGVVYEKLSGQLNLPAGTNVALIDIVPINNDTPSAPNVVRVSLSASGVSSSTASVIIFDDEERGHGLKKESYAGIEGTMVRDLTTHYRYPGAVQLATVPTFESNIAQGSGQVLSGFLTPPATDSYTFYIASANASELWLSSDSNPEHAVKISEELGTNAERNWPGYGSRSHISTPVPLTQGRWYFVQVIHKAGLGKPHLAVAWQRSGEDAPVAGSAPISGEYLSWMLPPSNTEAGGNLRMTRSPTGQLLLTVESAFRMPFTLEASGDLVRWQAISTNASIHQTDLFSLDPASKPQAKRFYRVSERPESAQAE